FNKMHIDPSDKATPGTCTGNECNIENVTGDVTVRAEFLGDNRVIGAFSEGGHVECDRTEVPHGFAGAVVCRAVPDTGYEVDGVPSVSGAATPSCSGDRCALSDIKGDVTITGTFAPIVGPKSPLNITATVSPASGGTVTCAPTSVAYGADVTINCTPTANSDYTFYSLVLSGGTCSGTTCSATSVMSDLTVYALFASKLPDLQVSLATDTDGKVPFRKAMASGNATIFNAGDTTATKVKWQAKKGSTVLDLGTVDSIAAKNTAHITIKADEAALEGATICVSAMAAEGDLNPEDNTNVCGPVKVLAAPAPGSNASPVPTLGEVGLLLSGLALAGAAAPALRRRERNEREQRSERKRA
ncbi:MAG: IPTL-CTERM sorting domain-containing protein, partial [Ottowia sp.]|nr:IPTL-CTERM sorting domain-containing protein [Ottowia sp.]